MFTYHVGRKRGRRTLQQVIHDDLSILASQFSSQLAESNAITTVGASFQLFLRIFEIENIALVHTMGLPPRCDPECFAQVLSASCLAFLHENYWNDLPFAAFGIFSLYALFQASQLPVLQPSPSGCCGSWQLFSMGIVHPDNPKLGYRRRFRQRIRIHRREYAAIQRWRHVFLGHCTTNSTDICGDAQDDGHPSRMMNILATDVLQVLNRLEFDWSEYTGPRGVDALAAGILDGCFVIHMPLEHGMEEIATEAGSSEEQDLTRTTEDALKHYHSKLQAIEVTSTSRQAKRVQVALEPLSGTHSWQDQMTKLAGRPLHGLGAREERVTVVELSAREDLESVSPTCDVTVPMHYRIRLPPTVSESLQFHITSSIQHLLQRGEKLLLPRSQARDHSEVIEPIAIAQTSSKETLSRHNNFLMVQDDLEANFDSDMSDVSDEEIHYALDDVQGRSDSDNNVESAAGLGALKVLLSQARPSAKNSRRYHEKHPSGDATSAAESSVGRKALMSLLYRATTEGRLHDTDDEAKMPPAKLSWRDEVSITDSSPGHQALVSLLRNADEDARVMPRTMGRRDATFDGTRRKPPPKRNQAKDEETSDDASSLGHNAMTNPSESALGKQDSSIANSSVGHQALSSLLRQVNNESITKRKSTSQRKVPARGARRAPDEENGKPAGKRRRSGIEASKDGVISASQGRVLPGDDVSSVAASSVGHQALSSLLKHANHESTAKRTSTSRRKQQARIARLAPDEGNQKSVRKRTRSGAEPINSGVHSDDSSISQSRVIQGDDVSSAAASSIGHVALSSLLKQVNDSTVKRTSVSRRKLPAPIARRATDERNRKPVRKQTRSRAEASNIGTLSDDASISRTGVMRGDDGSSVAASSIGHLALSSLLKQVNNDSAAKGTSTTRRQQPARFARRISDGVDKKPSGKRKRSTEASIVGILPNDSSISRTEAISGDEASSVAASSVGHLALSALLKRVSSENTSQQTPTKGLKPPDRSRRHEGNVKPAGKRKISEVEASIDGAIPEDDASSVAASSVGHQALSSLLKQVNNRSITKPKSISRRRAPARSARCAPDEGNKNPAKK